MFGELKVTPLSNSEPNDSDPTPIIQPDNQPTALVGQMSGAGSEDGSGKEDVAADIKLRSSGTDDSTDTLGRIITIIVAAAIGFIMIYIKRKNRDNNK